MNNPELYLLFQYALILKIRDSYKCNYGHILQDYFSDKPVYIDQGLFCKQAFADIQNLSFYIKGDLRCLENYRMKHKQESQQPYLKL